MSEDKLFDPIGFSSDILRVWRENDFSDIDGSDVQGMAVARGLYFERPATKADCEEEWAAEYGVEEGDPIYLPTSHFAVFQHTEDMLDEAKRFRDINKQRSEASDRSEKHLKRAQAAEDKAVGLVRAIDKHIEDHPQTCTCVLCQASLAWNPDRLEAPIIK